MSTCPEEWYGSSAAIMDCVHCTSGQTNWNRNRRSAGPNRDNNCECTRGGGDHEDAMMVIMNVEIVVVCAQGLKSIIHTRLGR